jgi:hypothetical protein
LTSGSGNLTTKLNQVLSHTLEAKILAFPRPISEQLSDGQKTSLLPHNVFVPPDVDAALLVAVQSDWKKKLITRSHLEPALPPSTIANPTFIINGVLLVDGRKLLLSGTELGKVLARVQRYDTPYLEAHNQELASVGKNSGAKKTDDETIPVRKKQTTRRAV